MDEKTELLISLGAATAANCVPCFEYYFKKASAVGLTSEEIEKTVEIGNKVKTGASIAMRRSIRDLTGGNGEADEQGSGKAGHPCCG